MFLTDALSFAFKFLIHPKEQAKKESTRTEAVLYLLILSVVSVLIGDLILFLQGQKLIQLVLYPILFIPVIIIEAFFNAALIHFFGRSLHYFKFEFSRTFVATAYGYTFSVLFGWIGLLSTDVSNLFRLIPLAYTYYAIMSQQEVTSKQASIAVILPTLILLAVTIFLAGAAYLYITSTFK